LNFGKYFKGLREEKKKTQKNIAEMIGKTTMYISCVELEKNAPFITADLKKISKKMELSSTEECELYKMAALTRGTLPEYLVKYVGFHDDAYELIETIARENFDVERLKKIKNYVEKMR
jgi:hypothetical protein